MQHHQTHAPPRVAYRVSEVAELIGLSKSQVYAMVARGEIGSKRSGRSVVVPVEALQAWLKTGLGATA